MPEWMVKYAQRFVRDQEQCEFLMNVKTNVVVNAPLSLEACSIQGQIRLLERLHKAGMLR